MNLRIKCTFDTDASKQPKKLPLLHRGNEACQPNKKCKECYGDCDTDADCALGLKCKQRTKSQPIPGCKAGGNGDKAGADYCVRPTGKANPLFNVGINGCKSSNDARCPACYGDCDNDSQCQPGLICFQRKSK